jgi:hypothetical protein
MWIFYFVVYGLYSLLAIVGGVSGEPNRVVVAETVIQQPLLVLATYCYTFRWRPLPRIAWNVVLVLSIIIWLLGFVDVLWPSLGLFRYLTGEERPSNMGNVTLTFISFLLDLPALYATYRLGNGIVRRIPATNSAR